MTEEKNPVSFDYEQVMEWLRGGTTACQMVNGENVPPCYRCILSGRKKPCAMYVHNAAADAIEKEVQRVHLQAREHLPFP